jgi:CBS domain-containing membrane protein
MEQSRVVSDIMTREVLVLSEEDNLRQIAEGMDRLSLRHLPVVDGTRLVGLVSHRDVLRLAVSALVAETPIGRAREQRLEENAFIAKVMTRDPVTVAPDTPLAEAANILVRSKFGCLPVVDRDHNLVGIVTEHDFLKLLVRVLK